MGGQIGWRDWIATPLPRLAMTGCFWAAASAVIIAVNVIANVVKQSSKSKRPFVLRPKAFWIEASGLPRRYRGSQ
jgi:hypothetical protein